MSRFTDRVVIITGAASGLGLATAERLADESASLVLVDRDEGALHALTDGLAGKVPLLAVRADVASLADVKAYVKAAVDRFGRIDGFFNNAGIEGKQNLTENFGEEEFHRVVKRFSAHAAAVALEEGFTVNHHKTRIMRREARPAPRRIV